MKDVTEKYIRINMDFPNKAGKLAQVLATQKRMITSLSRQQKVSPEVKELLVATAEGYDIANDLMNWMKMTLQGVADDAETLLEGSRIRNSHKMQSEEILMLWERIK